MQIIVIDNINTQEGSDGLLLVKGAFAHWKLQVND